MTLAVRNRVKNATKFAKVFSRQTETCKNLLDSFFCGFNPNCSDIYSDIHILTHGTLRPRSMSLFPPIPSPGRGDSGEG